MLDDDITDGLKGSVLHWRFRHDGAYGEQYCCGAYPLRYRSAARSQSRLPQVHRQPDVEPVLKCCDRAVGDSQLFKFGRVDLRAGGPAAHSVGEWAECCATSPARSPHSAAEAPDRRRMLEAKKKANASTRHQTTETGGVSNTDSGNSLFAPAQHCHHHVTVNCRADKTPPDPGRAS
jgi:hypothetical protein